MGCREGTDPADFAPGALDPIDDPSTPDPEVSILDATITAVGGVIKAQFPVVITDRIDIDITLRFDTANGSATAPDYYTARSNQTLTIPAGSTEGTIEITINNTQAASGVKYFLVNLSVPVNCTILDAQGRADYDWGTVDNPPPPPPPPPSGDPIDEPSYSPWAKPGVVYDQFIGCDYTYACTAAGSGAAMSALHFLARNSNKVFDWKKLYRDAGSCLSCAGSCDGENWLTMLRRLRDHGIKEQDSAIVHKIASFSELTDTTKAALIRKVKRVIVDQGAVYFVTPWYGSPNKGWNRCLSCNSTVIRDPDRLGPYGAHNSSCSWTDANLTLSSLGQHVFVITGWNDNKAGGSFEIQSSHGRDWGADGRCWMPYSFIGITGKWRYYKLVYGGTV